MYGRMSKQTSAAEAEDCRERLWSLIDGELDRASCAALVDRLCADRDVRRQWVLMNAACDALKSSEVASLHSQGFLDRVSVALEREPTVMATASWSSRRVMLRLVAPGAAVAAAIALLAVFAVPQLRGTDGGATQVAVVPAKAASAAKAAADPQAAEIARLAELERYLLAHRELAGGSVMPSSASYLRTSNNLPAESR
jgi:negative regulator of sigma E activity